MSTLFGIERDGEEIPLAFRSSMGMVWKNPLAKLLPSDTRVYALDNSPQGIYTIGDIKRQINEEDGLSSCSECQNPLNDDDYGWGYVDDTMNVKYEFVECAYCGHENITSET
jgi:hypothetical protein